MFIERPGKVYLVASKGIIVISAVAFHESIITVSCEA